MENLVKWRKKLLSPVKDSPWASEMVLNPAMIADPVTKRIHILFRATGPWKEAQIPGRPLPFPIFLGYGYSDDGVNFWFDLEKPALAPALEYEKDKISTVNKEGRKVVNYANGCIEDPRLFFVEEVCYMTVACRMFPPGPYWIHDDPVQCMPEWACGAENPYATQKNPTVNILYEVDLAALGKRDYKNAFHYVTELTNARYGEDRDVVLFPKKMMVKDELCYIMVHRPGCPNLYKGIIESRPSILIAAAKELSDFTADKCVERKLILAPSREWQSEKVGASTPPISLGEGKWLLNYHGKQNLIVGYAQSFMILKEQENNLPVIEKICLERMIVNEEPFENPSKFKTPCVFFTGLILHEGDLLFSYGAADENVGIMKVDFEKVIDVLNKC